MKSGGGSSGDASAQLLPRPPSALRFRKSSVFGTHLHRGHLGSAAHSSHQRTRMLQRPHLAAATAPISAQPAQAGAKRTVASIRQHCREQQRQRASHARQLRIWRSRRFQQACRCQALAQCGAVSMGAVGEPVWKACCRRQLGGYCSSHKLLFKSEAGCLQCSNHALSARRQKGWVRCQGPSREACWAGGSQHSRLHHKEVLVVVMALPSQFSNANRANVNIRT